MTTLDVSARRIVIGTWGCAIIVMVASAINAVLTFSSVGDNRVLGLATGIAVDIALCVGLIGDRLLARYGLSSAWGRALRILAAVMAVVLQVGAAVKEHHYFVALLHAFLPALLVALTEYGQDVLIKVTDLSSTSRPEADRGQTPPTALSPSGSTTTSSDSPVSGSWAPGTPASTSRRTPSPPASTASYATVASRPPSSPEPPGSMPAPVSPTKPRLVPAAPSVAPRKPTGDDTQVLALLAQGADAAAVATALGCSKRTAFRRMAAVKRSNESKVAAS